MMRSPAHLLTCVPGCCDCGWESWNRACPGLDVDTGKIGSGEPIVTPINDNRFWNGKPVAFRGGR